MDILSISKVSHLKFGNIPKIRIKNCPIPVDPFSTIFSALGLNSSHIGLLSLIGGSRLNQDIQLQGMYKH